MLLNAWRGPPCGVARASGAAVRTLARDAGVSERTLERRTRAATGFGPAELRRLVRFRRALRLHDAGVTNWATVAADAGYSDQPHLVREFRRFAGLTPTAWQAERVGFVQDGRVAAL
jgi:AraC-like DNA-binding protein